jgi:hypothetical protein
MKRRVLSLFIHLQFGIIERCNNQSPFALIDWRNSNFTQLWGEANKRFAQVYADAAKHVEPPTTRDIVWEFAMVRVWNVSRLITRAWMRMWY